MLRIIAALLFSASTLACASAAPPSNACGGFHLKILNDGTQDVLVTINASYSLTIDAGGSETIIEWHPPSKPLMPWTVVATSSTGDELGTLSFTGPVDQKLTVARDGMSAEPYDIREDDC